MFDFIGIRTSKVLSCPVQLESADAARAGAQKMGGARYRVQYTVRCRCRTATRHDSRRSARGEVKAETKGRVVALRLADSVGPPSARGADVASRRRAPHVHRTVRAGRRGTFAARRASRAGRGVAAAAGTGHWCTRRDHRTARREAVVRFGSRYIALHRARPIVSVNRTPPPPAREPRPGRRRAAPSRQRAKVAERERLPAPGRPGPAARRGQSSSRVSRDGWHGGPVRSGLATPVAVRYAIFTYLLSHVAATHTHTVTRQAQRRVGVRLRDGPARRSHNSALARALLGCLLATLSSVRKPRGRGPR